ncbi:MAG: hypothetical protein K9N21_02735 [Deltaproteobacteria bacterium]|nr:hypothetical protein [Deltaproteobacteria bacterium]
MRTASEIQSDIENLTSQIKSVEDEIAEKRASLTEQKSTNAKLFAANVSKARRPVSLQTQIEKIRSAEIELGQLSAALDILRGQLSELETEHHVASLKTDLDTYWPCSETYLGKAAEILAEIQAIVSSMDRITRGIKDFTKLQDPLVILQRVFSKIEDPQQWEMLGFSLNGEVPRYRFFNDLMAAERKIKNLPRLLGKYSDLWQRIELGGPNVASKFRYLSDMIPQEGAGAVRERQAGPTTKLTRGRSDIEKHPERYSPADLAKVGLKAKKTPPPPGQVVNMA